MSEENEFTDVARGRRVAGDVTDWPRKIFYEKSKDLQVQTASGSTGPEIVIEGFKEFEAIRDFLYTRMRG